MEFKKIDLGLHQDIAIQFRVDAFKVSFGTDEYFWEGDGRGGERYVEWLKKLNLNPFGGAFHIWRNKDIVGQMELGVFKGDREAGYVNLYYLREDYRGKGFSKELDDFAINFFKNLGLRQARLSVSPKNIRAMRFYKKNGWVDRGPRMFKREGHPLQNLVNLMEKTF